MSATQNPELHDARHEEGYNHPPGDFSWGGKPLPDGLLRSRCFLRDVARNTDTTSTFCCAAVATHPNSQSHENEGGLLSPD